MQDNILPNKVIDRLINYKLILSKYCYLVDPHINSSNLAKICGLTQETVRRDLMLINCQSTSPQKGYSINEIINKIKFTLKLEFDKEINIAIIGKNPFFVQLFNNEYSNNIFVLKAIFDFEYPTDGVLIDNFYHFGLTKISKIIKENKIEIAILNIISEYSEMISQILTNSGIKGIINMSPSSITVENNIHIEDFNLLSVLEKTQYYINKKA